MIVMREALEKLVLIVEMYNNVKKDKFRRKELNGAVLYLMKHPSLFFMQKQIECKNDSVMKNVNAIVNGPYIRRLYGI